MDRKRNDPPGRLIEQRRALLAGREIEYILKRSPRRRSMALQVNEAGLAVSVPLAASQRSIDNLLDTHAAWTLRQLDRWQALAQAAPFCFSDGIELPFLGASLRLALIAGVSRLPALRVVDDLRVSLADPTDQVAIGRSVEKWYRAAALPHFTARLDHWSRLMALSPRRLRLSSARTRWGSCNPAGDIRLAWRLIKAPPAVIDYVVVHELAHLKHLNHGQRFWALVERHLPDWRDARRELHRHGRVYHLF